MYQDKNKQTKESTNKHTNKNKTNTKTEGEGHTLNNEEGSLLSFTDIEIIVIDFE